MEFADQRRQAREVQGQQHQQQMAYLYKLKQKYEDRSDIAIALKNPIILFLRITSDLEHDPYLYWYAYSIGHIRNIFWGYYETDNHKFSLAGMCHFNNPNAITHTVEYKKTLGFDVVSTATKNRVSKTINKYLPEDMQLETTLNRIDLSKAYKYNTFLQMVNTEFLDYVEHNTKLLNNASRLCLYRDNCFNREELELFGTEGCDQYHYGDRRNPNYLHQDESEALSIR